MKSLLMIAYDFPPMLPGVRRTVAFARYLRECDWQPLVLTVKPVRTWAYDAAPLEEFAQNQTPIYRCGSWDPHRLSYQLSALKQSIRNKFPFFPYSASRIPNSSEGARIGGTGSRVLRYLRRYYYCPDDHVGWVGPAIRQARQLIARHQPAAIYTTSYPHSAHLVGLALKREFPQLPWLADFRDGWTQNADFFPCLSPRLQRKSAAMERVVALESDAILGVSEAITEHFRQLTTAQNKVIATLPNGFDDRDIESAIPKKWDGFSLLYAGTLYGHRSSEPILSAAAKAIAQDAGLREELRLVFVGKFDDSLLELAEKYGLRERLVLPGAMPYLSSLGAQKGADALVALLVETPNVEIILTQKIFEYLGCRKPVLALAPRRSALAKLVEETGAGLVRDPSSPDKGAAGLIELYRRIRSGQPPKVAPEQLARYSRRQQTREFAAILDSLVASGEKKP